MAGETLYSHHERGRRALTIGALAVAVGILVFCVVQSAPWWIYPPVLFVIFGLGAMVIADPRSGCVLDRERFRVYSGRWSEEVALVDIATVTIVTWSDGPPSATVTCRDGREVNVPSSCFSGSGPLRAALRSAGVPVERD